MMNDENSFFFFKEINFQFLIFINIDNFYFLNF